MILIKKHLCLIHVSEHKMWKADGFQKTNYLILLIIQSNIILHIIRGAKNNIPRT